jgi:hypothetical protein
MMKQKENGQRRSHRRARELGYLDLDAAQASGRGLQ